MHGDSLLSTMKWENWECTENVYIQKGINCSGLVGFHMENPDPNSHQSAGDSFCQTAYVRHQTASVTSSSDAVALINSGF